MSGEGFHRPDGEVAIVVLTYNRVHLLQKCVDDVLGRSSRRTTEIVIWNNASTDGTAAYLESLRDERIRVVNHERNIGQSAYGRAFRLTSAPYMIELDDDIIEAPADWDATLLDAFRRLPEIGFLAANLVDNPHDTTAQVMYHRNAHLYSLREVNGVRLKFGPTGGGCSMTSRELHDRVGGFKENPKQVFWLEDAAYIADIEKLGFRAAYLDDLHVLHAGGSHYAATPPEKEQYWRDFWRRVERRKTAKRILLRIPLVARLNAKHGWFEPPEPSS
jgi:GT2 family glycosyltransferase